MGGIAFRMTDEARPVDILLVDDHASNLLALKATLEPLHENLVEARSGREAIRLARDRDFAVILLDVHMPGMDGFEAAAQIRQVPRARRIPIIFVTALDASETHVSRGYSLGAVDYITKPFDPDALRAKVAAFSDIARQSEEYTSRVHRAEQERAANEERYRSLVENSWDAVILLDERGVVRYASPAITRILGYTIEEFVGRIAFDFVDPVDVERTMSLLGSILQSPGGRVSAELNALHKDGSVLRLEAVGVNLLADPSVQGIVANLRDITDRRRAEAAAQFLADASDILTSSLDMQTTLDRVVRFALPFLADICFVDLVDAGGEVRRVVTAHRDPAREFLLKELQRRFPPTRDSPHPTWDIVRTGKPKLIPETTATVHASFTQGPEHLALIRSVGLHSYIGVPMVARGRTIGVINLGLVDPGRKYSTEDLSTAKELCRRAALAIENASLYQEAQQELQERKKLEKRNVARAHQQAAVARLGQQALAGAELDTLLQTAARIAARTLKVRRCGILELLPGGETLELRDGVGTLTAAANETSQAGYTLIHGAPVVVPDLRKETRFGASHTALDGGIVSSLSVIVPGGDRVFGVMIVYASRARSFNEDDVFFVQSVANVVGAAVHRKRLEEELRQRAEDLAEADRRKDEFLAMLAHELRNPLGAISNALAVLTCSDSRETNGLRGIIERQTRNLAHMVDDLLDVARITQGKIDLWKEPIDLIAPVLRAVETCRRSLETRVQQLILELPPEPIVLEADAGRIEQVITNLLDNASKYTEPGGQITLSFSREGDEARISVRDNGIGMPAEMLPRVFDLFTQADRSLDRARGGLGIGLTLVRDIVELHGGAISAHSAGVGLGSEFIIRLPALAEEVSALAAPRARISRVEPPTPRRVLVVEDNAEAAETLRDLLEVWGHEVEVIHSGALALETAIAYHPDVILCDIGLPGVSGYDVARQIRKQQELRGITLVAVTGYGQDNDVRLSREAGFEHHLVKPLDCDALQQILGSAA